MRWIGINLAVAVLASVVTLPGWADDDDHRHSGKGKGKRKKGKSFVPPGHLPPPEYRHYYPGYEQDIPHGHLPPPEYRHGHSHYGTQHQHGHSHHGTQHQHEHLGTIYQPPIYQTPVQPPVYQPPIHQAPIQPPVYQPPVASLQPGDLDDFIEATVKRHFGHRVKRINVAVNQARYIKVELEVRDYTSFCQVRDFLASCPQIGGYQLRVQCQNLENLIERRIEQQFRQHVEDVEVDVDHHRQCVEIEVEICHPGLGPALQQFLATMPELAGYQVRLRVEVDD